MKKIPNASALMLQWFMRKKVQYKTKSFTGGAFPLRIAGHSKATNSF